MGVRETVNTSKYRIQVEEKIPNNILLKYEIALPLKDIKCEHIKQNGRYDICWMHDM